MRLTDWLRPLTALLGPGRPRRAARRLRLECLEGRDNPSGGLLDPTFGSGGVALGPLGSAPRTLTDVAALPDGQLLVAGHADGNFVAGRYRADGTLDTTFGSGGLTSVDFRRSTDRAMAVAVQPGSGGKILLAGTAYANGFAFGVVRLNPNGTLDTAFGGSKAGGKVTASPAARVSNEVYSMAVLPDGKFVLAGLARNLGSSASGSIALARFNANGTPDTTFGSNGTVLTTVTAMTGNDSGQHPVNVALDAAGRIVVSGTSPAGTSKDFLVARFRANGSLDTTFGAAGTGVVRTDVSGPNEKANALAVQADGKIVLGGWAASPDGDGWAALVRYNADGRLDPSFDGDGIALAEPVPGIRSGAQIHALAVQPGGQILAAGQGYYAIPRADGTDYYSLNLVVVMRFNGDGGVDTSYGPSGTGSVMTSLGYNSRVYAMDIQPDGRAVVAGAMNTSGPSASDPSPYRESFALVRFTASSASPSPVQVGSLAASSATATAGSPVTLTAGGVTTANPGATVEKVAFYSIDVAVTEQLLGYGTQNADGSWTLTFAAPLEPGSYTLLALGVDSLGAVSDPFSLHLEVV